MGMNGRGCRCRSFWGKSSVRHHEFYHAMNLGAYFFRYGHGYKSGVSLNEGQYTTLIQVFYKFFIFNHEIQNEVYSMTPRSFILTKPIFHS